MGPVERLVRFHLAAGGRGSIVTANVLLAAIETSLAFIGASVIGGLTLKGLLWIFVRKSLNQMPEPKDAANAPKSET